MGVDGGVRREQQACREVLPDAGVHPRPEREAVRRDAVWQHSVRLELVGVVAEHGPVAVHRQQVDHHLRPLGDLCARLQVEVG